MEFHYASDDDLDLLADWNRQLIQDEGHRNPMRVPELRERMRQWLTNEYQAIIFTLDSEPVAYALFTEKDDNIYIRQFFVRRDRRRNGIGRAAASKLLGGILTTRKRLTLEVLSGNTIGVAFWRSLGFVDYCVTMEIMPIDPNVSF